MFEVNREGRARAEAELRAAVERQPKRDDRGLGPDDWINMRWGADRREADANIMTQLTHIEGRLVNLITLVAIFAAGYFAVHVGYQPVAYGAPFIMAALVFQIEREFKRRQASLHRRMDRNLD
jgi:hypothetical protein